MFWATLLNFQNMQLGEDDALQRKNIYLYTLYLLKGMCTGSHPSFHYHLSTVHCPLSFPGMVKKVLKTKVGKKSVKKGLARLVKMTVKKGMKTVKKMLKTKVDKTMAAVSKTSVDKKSAKQGIAIYTRCSTKTNEVSASHPRQLEMCLAQCKGLSKPRRSFPGV